MRNGLLSLVSETCCEIRIDLGRRDGRFGLAFVVLGRDSMLGGQKQRESPSIAVEDPTGRSAMNREFSVDGSI